MEATAQLDASAVRANPWRWRPSTDSQCDALLAAIYGWRPSDEIDLPANAIVERLAEAAVRRDDWLLHPAVASLTLERPTAHNDLQLAVWTSVHTDFDLGTISIPRRFWVWAPDGGFELPEGEHALTSVAARVRKAADAPITLDIWSDSLGFPSPDGYPPPEQIWRGAEPLSSAEKARLRDEIVAYLRAVSLLVNLFPNTASWVRAVTRVVIGLRSLGSGSFGSGSLPNRLGIVYTDLVLGERYILEGIVHESAHHHLYLAEAGGPLVDPAHLKRYASPLRPEPRPLRGILLAYHALAYMCAFYTEWAATGLPSELERELDDLRHKCREAGTILDRNRHGLTPYGREFLDLTMGVAAYGA